ncbi:MAG: hypothetical protein KDC38_12475, partial [Planctomycetes bacterium]|nr:hypothetical protein [Planctomycetota bacterium]
MNHPVDRAAAGPVAAALRIVLVALPLALFGSAQAQTGSAHAQTGTAPTPPWEARTYGGGSAASPAGPGAPPPLLQGPAFHAGAEPLALCFDSLGAVYGVPTLYVADLFTGNAYLYAAADLSLLGSIPTPSGASTTSGLATEGASLYWVADDTLYTSAMDGTGLAAVGVLALPFGGVTGDICFDDLGQLWAIDVINDVISAHSPTTGAALGPWFAQPSAPGAFGNGLAFRLDCNRFEVLHGATASGQVTDVSVVTSQGVPLGGQSIGGLGPFLNGVESVAISPAAGVPSLFVVENSSGAIYEIAALDPCPPQPADCHALAGTSLTLPFTGFPTQTLGASPGSVISAVLPTTTSTVTASGLTGTVQRVSCAVSIAHTWIGDLDVTLRHV